MSSNIYSDLFSLENKVVLVTGATGYLGTSISLALASSGAHVLINGRTDSKLDILRKKILNIGGSCEIAKFDVLEKKQVEKYFKDIGDVPLHGLVNNAYAGNSGTFMESEDSHYFEAYEISVIACQRVIKAAMPLLRLARKNGADASVINIASMYALVSPDLKIYSDKKTANPPYYGSSKAALVQFSKYIACELGSEGIRVNCISPGAFPSINTQKTNPKLIKQLVKKIPLKRIGKPHEVGASVVFLLTKGAQFITGENLVIDGGWTSW